MNKKEDSLLFTKYIKYVIICEEKRECWGDTMKSKNEKFDEEIIIDETEDVEIIDDDEIEVIEKKKNNKK